MKNLSYSIPKIMEIIRDQFNGVIMEDYEFYSNYTIRIENEQIYVPDEDRKDKNIIYIVVKFGHAKIDYDNCIVPFSINAISECNKFNVCQRLLMDYAMNYNLHKGYEDPLYSSTDLSEDGESNSYLYMQTYTTPQIMNSFEAVYEGYRNTFFMSGSVLLGAKINPLLSLTYVYNDGTKDVEEEVELVNFSCSYDGMPDSQPYFNNHNFVNSIMKFGSYAFNVTTYLTDCALINNVLSLVYRRDKNTVNQTFRFKFRYVSMDSKESDGYYHENTFKLQNWSQQQSLGELPLLTMSFIL